MEDLTIRAPQLQAAVQIIVERGGSSPLEAERVASNLIEANLTGHDSHGVGMIPRYVAALQDGGLRVNQHVSLALDAGAMLRLDGHAGYGQVIGLEAMQLGIERARAQGVCALGIAGSHHLGRIGHWAEQCAAQGLISMHFVNVVSRPVVAPWGGRDARLGTNPVCVGIPRADRPPIVLDFATSRIAQGKTRVARNRGEDVPPGVLIDDLGDPTTDPKYAVVPPFGAILPFGEHKGYGLALICELLGGALTGGQTQHGLDGGQKRILNGMFSVIIDPNAMGTAAHLTAETEAFAAWVQQSPPSGTEPVQLPGDPERARKRERLERGIAVDAITWAEILQAAESLGLEPDVVSRAAGA